MLAAMWTGVRDTLQSGVVRSLLVRAALFGVCGAALWGLLPTLGVRVLQLSPQRYGGFAACIGVGVVASAGFLNRLQRAVGRDAIIAIASAVLGAAVMTLAMSNHLVVLYSALVVAGAAWVSLNSTFIAAIQSVTPAAERARVMGVYLVVLLGGMAAGSMLFGEIAQLIEAHRSLAVSTRASLALAGIALVVAAALQTAVSGAQRRSRPVAGTASAA